MVLPFDQPRDLAFAFSFLSLADPIRHSDGFLTSFVIF